MIGGGPDLDPRGGGGCNVELKACARTDGDVGVGGDLELGYGAKRSFPPYDHNYGVVPATDEEVKSRRRNSVDDDNFAGRGVAATEYATRRRFFKNRANARRGNSVSPGKSAARYIFLLVVCTVGGMSTWFSAGAVLPQLSDKYGIDETEASILSLAVNFGFLIGVLVAVSVNIADVVAPSRLMTAGCALAALMNAGILISGTFLPALLFRVATGASMALVYPQACKVASSWCVENRGLAIGAVVGSVGLGSSSPHLIKWASGGSIGWEVLIASCSCATAFSGFLCWMFLVEGPHVSPSPSSSTERAPTRAVALGLLRANRPYWMAVLGYCGHNWELYALWLWIKAFARDAGYEENASAVAFAVVSVSFVGSIAGGVLADRLGRSTVCLFSSFVSFIASLATGWTKEGAAFALGVLWGLFSIAESAQYSALVSEVVSKRLVGTAVSIQFGIGFLLTMPGMYIVPTLIDKTGSWPLAWGSLSPGTLVAICAMVMIRKNKDAIAAARSLGRSVV